MFRDGVVSALGLLVVVAAIGWAGEPVPTDSYGDPLPPGAVARLGTLRFRHEGWGHSLGFTPDGKELASTSWEGQVYFWDAGSGRPLRQFRLPYPVALAPLEYALAISPDGKTLVVADRVGVRLLDPVTGKQRLRLDVPPSGFDSAALRFSPDGKTLAVAADGVEVHLFDAATGRQRLRLQVGEAIVYALAFAPDGASLAVNGQKSPVLLWDVRTGKLLRHLGEGEALFNPVAIAFSPDGKTGAWGGWGDIELADAGTGKPTGKLTAAKLGLVNALAFTPDGKTLISGSQDGSVRLWDVSTMRERLRLDAHMGPVESLALSPDGKTVVAGSYLNVLRLWDVASGTELFVKFQGHDGRVNDVAYAPDGKTVAVADDAGAVVFWDPAAAHVRRRLAVDAPQGMAFSPDGRRLVDVPSSQSFHVWDIATGRQVFTLRPPSSGGKAWVRRTAFTPDGRTVVSCHTVLRNGQLLPGILAVWDASTGKLLRQIDLAPGVQESLALAADGRTAAVGMGDGSIHLWDLRSGKEVLVLTGHDQYVTAVAFSPDGQLLASGSLDQTVRVWEVRTGTLVCRLRGDGRAVNAVAFAPDGRLLASAGGTRRFPTPGEGPKRISFWDVASGAEVGSLRGHEANVNALSFAPDGSRLVTGLDNTTALVWELGPLRRAVDQSRKALAAESPEALWQDLAAADAARGQRAVAALAAQPGRAVPLLKARLRPAPAVEPARLRRLLHDLDSEQFGVRDAAVRDLEEVVDQAGPALHEALHNNPSAEVRRRLEGLLARPHVASAPELVRGLRAVQVLEQIGSEEARRVLRGAADGAPEAWLTQDARAALQRLASRPR
jgi:WD40 repeat protein